MHELIYRVLLRTVMRGGNRETLQARINGFYHAGRIDRAAYDELIALLGGNP